MEQQLQQQWVQMAAAMAAAPSWHGCADCSGLPAVAVGVSDAGGQAVTVVAAAVGAACCATLCISTHKAQSMQVGAVLVPLCHSLLCDGWLRGVFLCEYAEQGHPALCGGTRPGALV